jgi:hypothetical protein
MPSKIDRQGQIETTISQDLEETDAKASSKSPAFDPAALRLPQNYAQMVGVQKRITTIRVQKPGKQDFVRVHSDPAYCLQTMLLEFKDENESFLVAPPLWGDLIGELIPKILYLTVNRQKVYRLWPIRLPDEEGRLDDWNRSALEAAEIARERWIRVTSNRALGAYEIYVAQSDLGDPTWPELTFEEVLQIAFKDRYIADLDHPAIRRLRGYA